jgi:hypothetical protein
MTHHRFSVRRGDRRPSVCRGRMILPQRYYTQRGIFLAMKCAKCGKLLAVLKEPAKAKIEARAAIDRTEPVPKEFAQDVADAEAKRWKRYFKKEEAMR